MSQTSPSARRKARRFTLQALYQWQLAGAAVSDIEAQFLANQDFAKVDREYFHDLLHGVLGQVKTLDELLTPYLDRGWKSCPRWKKRFCDSALSS